MIEKQNIPRDSPSTHTSSNNHQSPLFCSFKNDLSYPALLTELYWLKKTLTSSDISRIYNAGVDGLSRGDMWTDSDVILSWDYLLHNTQPQGQCSFRPYPGMVYRALWGPVTYFIFIFLSYAAVLRCSPQRRITIFSLFA